MFAAPISYPRPGYKHSFPFHEVRTAIVVRKEREERGMWGILDPFEPALWVAIVGAIVAGGVVIASLEPVSKFSKREPMLGRAETVLKAQYHAWALLLSGDERDWATWSQRLFRVGFLTLSMIIIAT